MFTCCATSLLLPDFCLNWEIIDRHNSGRGRKNGLVIVQDLILRSHGVPVDRWLCFIALSRLFPESCLHLAKALKCQMVVCVCVCIDGYPDVCNPLVTLKNKDE